MSSVAPDYAFATPFLNPPASPIRSLMPYAMRPGTISLAGGYPAQELFDVDGLSIASTQVMARLGACLQYSNICLLYTSPSPRDKRQSRMPSSA